ncbi:MAG: TolC family protein [Planctomycetes bacterium]|nr:TolC family protein [Planctomycetota bacterium]
MPHRLTITALLLASCAVDADRFDRAHLSPELEQRTGHGLGSGAQPGETAIPDGVVLDDGVSTEEAVAIALWNNAAFQAALSELGLKRAELIQAGLFANPSFGILFPIGPKQLEATLSAPLDAIWLRPGRIAVAELECERVAGLLVQGGLDLVRDVRVACADLALARANVGLASEMLELRKSAAEFFAARLRAGDVSELEAQDAAIESSTAAQQLARATHESDLAEARLRSLLGLGLDPEGPKVLFLDERAESIDREFDDEQLQSFAQQSRPDLRAAELLVDQAGERAGLASWQILRLTGVWDANAKGSEGFESGPGLQLELPLFDLGDGRSAKARAEVEQTVRQLWAVRHRVRAEVAEAIANARQAIADSRRCRAIITPAVRQARDGARRAYESGNTSLLPLLLREVRLGEARSLEAQAAREERRALAELERSVGRRLGAEERP